MQGHKMNDVCVFQNWWRWACCWHRNAPVGKSEWMEQRNKFMKNDAMENAEAAALRHFLCSGVYEKFSSSSSRRKKICSCDFHLLNFFLSLCFLFVFFLFFFWLYSWMCSSLSEVIYDAGTLLLFIQWVFEKKRKDERCNRQKANISVYGIDKMAKKN